MLILCYYQAAKFSSNWNNATNAGTFNWNLNNATSNVNRNISTRLTYFIYSLIIPCLLAKHKNVNAMLVGLFSKTWQFHKEGSK